MPDRQQWPRCQPQARPRRARATPPWSLDLRRFSIAAARCFPGTIAPAPGVLPASRPSEDAADGGSGGVDGSLHLAQASLLLQNVVRWPYCAARMTKNGVHAKGHARCQEDASAIGCVCGGVRRQFPGSHCPRSGGARFYTPIHAGEGRGTRRVLNPHPGRNGAAWPWPARSGSPTPEI